MLRFRRNVLLSSLMLLFTAGSFAQSAKPVITQIDPPNWFTRFPDSLLLVHGQHLEATTFSVRDSAARITETTVSPNGHWAFLTFETAQAAPGTLQIVASNSHGSTAADYVLSAPRPASQQPRGFGPSDVMYLIMPDRFADGDIANDRLSGFHEPDDRTMSRAYHGGDLRGIQDHLDYLRQLGVTAIWTTPLYDNSAGQSGQSYHGYSATNMYAVDPHFGSMADYAALVDAAHRRGMKVVLDTVPNHVGPAHPWASDPPTPDWFHGSVDRHIETDDDFASITDTHAAPARRVPLLDGWFADRLPDLNQGNPLVAQYLLQNAVWWIESAGLDGLRIDTFPYVPRSFWQDYNQQLHGLFPQLMEVGEIFNGSPVTTSFFAGGQPHTGSDGTFDTHLDTPFDYPMYFALREALMHKKPMSAIAAVLEQDKLYTHPENLVTFIGNHDVKRFLSEPGANLPALRLAFGLLATLRGMPQLYYGDELGMTGGDDPDNRKDFPGGFPNDSHDAFLASGRSDAQQSLFAWAQTLMQLRARTPALQTGRQQTILADTNTLAFIRTSATGAGCSVTSAMGSYLVVVNNDPAVHDITLAKGLPPMTTCTHYQPMLNNDARAQVVQGGLEVHLSGQQIGIFEIEP